MGQSLLSLFQKRLTLSLSHLYSSAWAEVIAGWETHLPGAHNSPPRKHDSDTQIPAQVAQLLLFTFRPCQGLFHGPIIMGGWAPKLVWDTQLRDPYVCILGSEEMLWQKLRCKARDVHMCVYEGPALKVRLKGGERRDCQCSGSQNMGWIITVWEFSLWTLSFRPLWRYIWKWRNVSHIFIEG